jgi:hypothetical protein
VATPQAAATAARKSATTAKRGEMGCGAIGKLSKAINLSFSAKKITSHILVIL